MVKFRLDEAFVNAGSGTPGNRSVWDMLFPRMLFIFSRRVFLRGDLFPGVVLLGAQGLLLTTLDL